MKVVCPPRSLLLRVAQGRDHARVRGAVISEMVASNEGIGYLMMSAGSSMRMPLVFAGLIVISAMAMAMYEFFAV